MGSLAANDLGFTKSIVNSTTSVEVMGLEPLVGRCTGIAAGGAVVVTATAGPERDREDSVRQLVAKPLTLHQWTAPPG